MKRVGRLTYEHLVIKSLKTGEKDFTELATDFYIELLENDRGTQMRRVKSDLSTDILLEMINKGKIYFNEGTYELPQKVIP